MNRSFDAPDVICPERKGVYIVKCKVPLICKVGGWQFVEDQGIGIRVISRVIYDQVQLTGNIINYSLGDATSIFIIPLTRLKLTSRLFPTYNSFPHLPRHRWN